MDIAKIHHEANCLIAETYGTTSIPVLGSVIVTDKGKSYKVHFQKVEEEKEGWNITYTEAI